MPHDVVRRQHESEVTNPLLEALMTLYMDVHEALPAGTTAADVAAVHREAHGLVADRLFPVVEGQ